MREISARELKSRLDDGAGPLLVDVREDWEIEMARFPGAREVPLDRLTEALADEPRDREVVVICHHGGRSFTAAMLLERAGFTAVANLAGGIDGWSGEVDPSVPRY